MSAPKSNLSKIQQWTSSAVAITTQDPKITVLGGTPLCRRCIVLFTKSENQSILNRLQSLGIAKPEFTLYSYTRNFLKAVEKGCFICICVRSCFTESQWKEVLAKRHDPVGVFNIRMKYVTKINRDPEMTFLAGNRFAPTRTRFRLLKSVGSQEIPGIEPIVPTNTGSPEALHLAKFWLLDCLADHASCGPFATGIGENTWLPTRLIHITLTGARLESREDASRPAPRYATLSHCWGTKTIFTTVESNIEQLHTSIPIDLLPKTFLNAITVCRTLDIEYIWIDSLCIIQDSNEDWTREAKQMGNVYKNCSLNIAATGFKDGEKGFFVDREPQEIRPFKVKSEGSPFVPEGEYHLIWASKWHNEVLTAPLNTRGWVFQERLLSPRILSFGAREIFWECKEREACESYPNEFPASGEPLTNQISNQRDFKSSNPLDDLEYARGQATYSNNLLVVWDYWKTIVEIYSGTDLTNEKDKLIALSGVIKEMKKLLASEYLAGIWRLHLNLQLLWDVPQDQYHRVSRPTNPQGPSWSWVSLNSRVRPWGGPVDVNLLPKGCRYLSKLLSADLSVNESDEFVSGELQFRGPLIEAAIEPADRRFASRYTMTLYPMPRLRVYVTGKSGVEYLGIYVELKPDNVREWDKEWAPYFQEPVDTIREHRRMEIARWPDLMSSNDGFPKSIFLLPIVSAPFKDYGKGDDDDDDDDNKAEEEDEEEGGYENSNDSGSESGDPDFGFHGLVLFPTGNLDGVYKRIGMFSSLSGQEKDVYIGEILQAKLALKREAYQRCEGQNQFVITII